MRLLGRSGAAAKDVAMKKGNTRAVALVEEALKRHWGTKSSRRRSRGLSPNSKLSA